MADLCWLSDAQWVVIEPFMPTNQPGARRVDDRRVAARYDKLAATFASAIALAGVIAFWCQAARPAS